MTNPFPTPISDDHRGLQRRAADRNHLRGGLGPVHLPGNDLGRPGRNLCQTDSQK